MQWDVYSAIKRDEVLKHATVWINLENIMPIEGNSHKSPHTVFYLYEISSTVKSIEKKKQISVWQWLGEGNNGNRLLNS